MYKKIDKRTYDLKQFLYKISSESTRALEIVDYVVMRDEYTENGEIKKGYRLLPDELNSQICSLILNPQRLLLDIEFNVVGVEDVDHEDYEYNRLAFKWNGTEFEKVDIEVPMPSSICCETAILKHHDIKSYMHNSSSFVVRNGIMERCKTIKKSDYPMSEYILFDGDTVILNRSALVNKANSYIDAKLVSGVKVMIEVNGEEILFREGLSVSRSVGLITKHILVRDSEIEYNDCDGKVALLREEHIYKILQEINRIERTVLSIRKDLANRIDVLEPTGYIDIEGVIDMYFSTYESMFYSNK